MHGDGILIAPESGPGDLADGGWGVGLEGSIFLEWELGLEGLVGEGLLVVGLGLDGLDLEWVAAAGLGLITVVSFSLELTLSAR